MSFFGLFDTTNMSEKIQEYLNKGAVVIDVRSLEEWDTGHVLGSKHVVLAIVPLRLDEIRTFNKPVIAVCRSGARSGQATRFLVKEGIDAINGGPWQDVAKFID